MTTHPKAASAQLLAYGQIFGVNLKLTCEKQIVRLVSSVNRNENIKKKQMLSWLIFKCNTPPTPPTKCATFMSLKHKPVTYRIMSLGFLMYEATIHGLNYKNLKSNLHSIILTHLQP